MSSDNSDLLRHASQYAEQGVDLYELLGIDALTTREDIHRAWRKRSLKHHPDKAGANFDASTWELYERARDVLSDPNARAAYDAAARAKLLRRQEREVMDRERRQLVDDLEAREGAARRDRRDREQREREALQRERERLAQAQRTWEEEGRVRAQAEQEAEDLAEARRRLREKKEETLRRRQAREAIKAGAGLGAARLGSLGTGLGRQRGPANGLVAVPGDYVADVEGAAAGKRKYWELVCDKLRAVQAVRNLQMEAAGGSDSNTTEEMREAERLVQEARRRIQDAEVQFQKETTAC